MFRCLQILSFAYVAAAAVPTVEIAPGVQMPQIGLGTCCGSQPKVGLVPWIQAGGTAVDTAYDYGKSVQGGKQTDVAAAMKTSGISRDQIFITTKTPGGWCTFQGPPGKAKCDALATLKLDLKELNVDYVDLVLLHSPGSSSLNAKQWAQLEDALAQNLTRAIGVSNYNAGQLSTLLKTAKVKPAVNQCQMSVNHHNDKTIEFCQKNNITHEAYYVMKGCPMKHATITKIAAAHGKSAAQVCLRYILDRGCVMAVGTSADATKAAKYAKENLDIFDFKLTDAEVSELNGIGDSTYLSV